MHIIVWNIRQYPHRSGVITPYVTGYGPSWCSGLALGALLMRTRVRIPFVQQLSYKKKIQIAIIGLYPWSDLFECVNVTIINLRLSIRVNDSR